MSQTRKQADRAVLEILACLTVIEVTLAVLQARATD